jgi:hypothetical protein
MLRTLLFALAIATPGLAAAEEFPQSAIGIEVRSDDGTVVGRVNAVERDADGRIVAAEVEGLEPADAPAASPNLIAQDDEPVWQSVNDREASDRDGAGGRVIASR